MIEIITLALSFTLTRHCVDDVYFSTYECNSPTQVVFLMAGLNMNDEYWFAHTDVLNKYNDILFVSCGHSDTLSTDLRTIIDWVNENYDFPNKNQWSFCGFSNGAYKLYEVVLKDYHDVFGNYGAFSGGQQIYLDEDPQIYFFYSCAGSNDVGIWATQDGINYLKSKDYINDDNSINETINGFSHSWELTEIGIQSFIANLNERKEYNNGLLQKEKG